MSRPRGAVTGHVPWTPPAPYGAAPHGVQPDTAPTRDVVYVCPAGHRRTVRLSAEAFVPPRWDCRACGEQAALDDAAGGELEPIPLAPKAPSTGKTHWQHVLERRTIPELEAILAERLEWLRARRGVPASRGQVADQRRAAS